MSIKTQDEHEALRILGLVDNEHSKKAYFTSVMPHFLKIQHLLEKLLHAVLKCLSQLLLEIKRERDEEKVRKHQMEIDVLDVEAIDKMVKDPPKDTKFHTMEDLSELASDEGNHSHFKVIFSTLHEIQLCSGVFNIDVLSLHVLSLTVFNEPRSSLYEGVKRAYETLRLQREFQSMYSKDVEASKGVSDGILETFHLALERVKSDFEELKTFKSILIKDLTNLPSELRSDTREVVDVIDTIIEQMNTITSYKIIAEETPVRDMKELDLWAVTKERMKDK